MRPWLQHSQQITEQYVHHEPLHLFIKKYFKKYPILGSRDRRAITHLVYSFYRAAKGFENISSWEEKLLQCLLITATDDALIQKCFPKATNESSAQQFQLHTLIDPLPPLSTGIDQVNYLSSLLRSTQVFIRIMMATTTEVKAKLQAQRILFHELEEGVLAFSPGVKLDTVLSPEEYVVQDYSSQKITAPLLNLPIKTIWDCCAGAGGKSIWLRQNFPNSVLFSSDIRKNMLHHLSQRFKQYGLKKPVQRVIDLEDAGQIEKALGGQIFDVIVADVPCSGSGTWARNPEEAYFFNAAQLERFTERQAHMVDNILPFIAPQGFLLYATCSVFYEENEKQIERIQEKGWKLIESKVINGWSHKADMMYSALLQKQ